ncbi:hypothetical protein ASPWEDRAFT_173777 [Aspergillus wentii DTO 134E9]|uniref:Zn(2)-C6 fungal-type domain-containing protein n=1 Tax=Aspergillus wentii DTO 134E9 TaxID=1073089 RepID=A0A1L9RHF0_ASPWE|nr:uncharacterized protein ASPWEDRAFT_173777 [Aspergillus wentii DTO 134E9]OJJ34361.1 hypothetical protein ASPWEDRAFT_173777 [Aspergillus wentii DTO 134E9]
MPPSELISGVMTHPFYHSEEETSFVQQSKMDPLSIPRSTRNDHHQETVDRSSSCVSPSAEPEGKSRNPARRRAPVACVRCRKRKIKCSGDTGDGQGCSNCRNSGNTNCLFLRVNSHNAWPYPTMNATQPSSTRLGIYPPHMASKPGDYSVNSPNMRVASFSRSSDYDMGLDSQHAFSRQPFGVDPSLNYEEDPSTTHSSAYMVPTGHQGALPDYYGIAWNTKGWSPGMPINKASNGALYHDQDESSLTQPNYSYMLPGQGTQATDAPSLGPAMTLVSDGQGTDRTLPTPTIRNQLQTSISTLPTSPEAISGLPFSQDFRVGNIWAPKSAPSTSSRSSMRAMSNGAYSASLVSREKPIPSSAQDMVFGFISMTSAGTPSPLIPSSGAFTGTGLDTVDSADDFRAATDARLTRSYSRDHGRLMSLTDCSPDVYGYSSSEKNKNRSDDTGSAATLMNGLPYTPVRHSDNHGALPFHLLPTDAMPDYRTSTEVHRTSISSHSNPGGFYHQQELLKPT